MATISLVKKLVSPSGIVSYGNPGVKGTVRLTKHLFEGEPPETIVIDGEGLVIKQGSAKTRTPRVPGERKEKIPRRPRENADEADVIEEDVLDNDDEEAEETE